MRRSLPPRGEALPSWPPTIDLNSVRADIVRNPKNWRWIGYGAALGGVRKARDGLRQMVRLHRGAKLRDKKMLAA